MKYLTRENILTAIIGILTILFVVSGPVAFAVGENIQSNTGIVGLACSTKKEGCGWDDLLLAVHNFINYLLYFSATLATLSIAYAGWLYLTSGGDSGQREKANKIFWKIIQGFLFAFCAWLIVQTILKGVRLEDGYSLLT